MLRAVGIWPISIPWRFVALNAVSGSMFGPFVPQSARLRVGQGLRRKYGWQDEML